MLYRYCSRPTYGEYCQWSVEINNLRVAGIVIERRMHNLLLTADCSIDPSQWLLYSSAPWTIDDRALTTANNCVCPYTSRLPYRTVHPYSTDAASYTDSVRGSSY